MLVGFDSVFYIIAPAVRADQLCGENARHRETVRFLVELHARLHLVLHRLVGFHAHDGLVIVFNPVARKMTVILFHFMGKRIAGEALLRHNVSGVGDVLQDVLDRGNVAARPAFRLHPLGDVSERYVVQEVGVD